MEGESRALEDTSAEAEFRISAVGGFRPDRPREAAWQLRPIRRCGHPTAKRPIAAPPLDLPSRRMPFVQPTANCCS